MIRFLRVLTKYLTVAKSRYFVPLLPMKDTHQFLVESEFFVLPRSLLTLETTEDIMRNKEDYR